MQAAAKSIAEKKASSDTKASSSKVPLRAPLVTVRVRPLAQEGGHSATGQFAKGVYKKLAKWDEGVIVLEDEVERASDTTLPTSSSSSSSSPYSKVI